MTGLSQERARLNARALLDQRDLLAELEAAEARATTAERDVANLVRDLDYFEDQCELARHERDALQAKVDAALAEQARYEESGRTYRWLRTEARTPGEMYVFEKAAERAEQVAGDFRAALTNDPPKAEPEPVCWCDAQSGCPRHSGDLS